MAWKKPPLAGSSSSPAERNTIDGCPPSTPVPTESFAKKDAAIRSDETSQGQRKDYALAEVHTMPVIGGREPAQPRTAPPRGRLGPRSGVRGGTHEAQLRYP